MSINKTEHESCLHCNYIYILPIRQCCLYKLILSEASSISYESISDSSWGLSGSESCSWHFLGLAALWTAFLVNSISNSLDASLTSSTAFTSIRYLNAAIWNLGSRGIAPNLLTLSLLASFFPSRRSSAAFFSLFLSPSCYSLSLFLNNCVPIKPWTKKLVCMGYWWVEGGEILL